MRTCRRKPLPAGHHTLSLALALELARVAERGSAPTLLRRVNLGPEGVVHILTVCQPVSGAFYEGGDAICRQHRARRATRRGRAGQHPLATRWTARGQRAAAGRGRQ